MNRIDICTDEEPSSIALDIHVDISEDRKDALLELAEVITSMADED